MQPVFVFPFFCKLYICLFVCLYTVYLNKNILSKKRYQQAMRSDNDFQFPEAWAVIFTSTRGHQRWQPFRILCISLIFLVSFFVDFVTTHIAASIFLCWKKPRRLHFEWINAGRASSPEAVTKQKKDGWIVSLLFLYHFQLNSGFIEFADDCILLWSTFYTEPQPFWKLGWSVDVGKNTIQNK